MRGARTAGGYLLRVEKGEELLSALAAFATRHDILAASLTAIGAVRDAELGYFYPEEQRYDRRRLAAEYELVHLSGNVSRRDGAPFVHAHAVLGGPALECLSGHLFSATVAVTVEVHLVPLGGPVERRLDPAVGIALLDLPEI